MRPPTGRAISQSWPPTAEQKFSQQRPGRNTPLGSGTLQILQGGSEDADSVNDASLCTLFTAGDFRFLDTGDAEADAEQRLVDTYGPDPACHSFQGGAHGPTPPTA